MNTGWQFLEGHEFYKPFIEGKPLSDCHDVATYAIVRDGHNVKQDGTHGTSCRCGEEVDDCGHLIASDEPYYNTAPSYIDAKRIVAAMNALRQIAEFTSPDRPIYGKLTPGALVTAIHNTATEALQ